MLLEHMALFRAFIYTSNTGLCRDGHPNKTKVTLSNWYSYLKEDGKSEKEAQPVSLAGTGASVLHTAEPTESRLAPCAVSIGTSKFADQLGAEKISWSSLGTNFYKSAHMPNALILSMYIP